jgi:YHS domain-containing protein
MDEKQIPDSRPNPEIVPSASSEAQPLPAAAMHADPATVKDPVCGMNVNSEKAGEQGLTLERNGKTYAFCSLECKEDFQRQGSQGVEAAAGSPPSDHAGHRQPVQQSPSADTGHASKQQPVKDQICGMNVNPDTARDLDLTFEVDGQTYYFCSEECKEEFRRLGPQAKASSTPGHEGHNHD